MGKDKGEITGRKIRILGDGKHEETASYAEKIGIIGAACYEKDRNGFHQEIGNLRQELFKFRKHELPVEAHMEAQGNQHGVSGCFMNRMEPPHALAQNGDLLGNENPYSDDGNKGNNQEKINGCGKCPHFVPASPEKRGIPSPVKPCMNQKQTEEDGRQRFMAPVSYITVVDKRKDDPQHGDLQDSSFIHDALLHQYKLCKIFVKFFCVYSTTKDGPR